MVHFRGMVHEEWYMVQESKLWYDYYYYGTVRQRCKQGWNRVNQDAPFFLPLTLPACNFLNFEFFCVLLKY